MSWQAASYSAHLTSPASGILRQCASVKSTHARNRFAVRYFDRYRSLQSQVACARTSHRPKPLRLAGWLRQFGYSRRFSGLIFLDVCRERVLRPGRRGYSRCGQEDILERSFGNVGKG